MTSLEEFMRFYEDSEQLLSLAQKVLPHHPEMHTQLYKEVQRRLKSFLPEVENEMSSEDTQVCNAANSYCAGPHNTDDTDAQTDTEFTFDLPNDESYVSVSDDTNDDSEIDVIDLTGAMSDSTSDSEPASDPEGDSDSESDSAWESGSESGSGSDRSDDSITISMSSDSIPYSSLSAKTSDASSDVASSFSSSSDPEEDMDVPFISRPSHVTPVVPSGLTSSVSSASSVSSVSSVSSANPTSVKKIKVSAKKSVVDGKSKSSGEYMIQDGQHEYNRNIPFQRAMQMSMMLKKLSL